MKKILGILAISLLLPASGFSAQQTINNGETFGQARTKLNANYTELYAQAATKWVTGTAYTADNQLVVYGGNIYVCVTSHTAGTFATDLAAGKWKLWGSDIVVSTVRTTAGGGSTTAPPSEVAVGDALATKQDSLVSGTSIKTINSTSLLGSGDIVVSGLGTLPTATYQILQATGEGTYDWTSTLEGISGISGLTSLALPQGASPTVDAAGEVALDITSDQLIFYGASKHVVTGKYQENFVVKSPVDDDFLLFKARQAITITDIHVIAQGGTSISIDIQECDSAGANCSSVDAAITADTDGAEDDGTLSNPTIDAGDWVKVVLGAPSGTVNFVSGSIYYNLTAD